MILGGRKTRVLLFTLFCCLFLAYLAYEANDLILGPKIEIYEPQNGTHYTEPALTIKGKAKNVSKISLNDRPIFTDTEGVFEEKLILLPGYNIMTIKASDRFGKTVSETLELTLERKEVIPEPEIIDVNTSTSTDSGTTTIDILPVEGNVGTEASTTININNE